MHISTIKLSEKAEIRVSKDTVNEKTFGQVRTWIRKKDSDEFIPTRKGIAFDLAHTDDIVKGLLTLADTTEGATS